MYLAKIQIDSTLHFHIRQSFFDQKTHCYLYREIYDLGRDPTNFIEIFDERIFFFKEELEAAVAAWTDDDPTLLLEELLWNYLPRSIRDRLSITYRGKNKILNRSLSDKDQEAIAREIHLFDRRRLYFLRYNGVDQSRLYRMHEKLCRPLLGQSRDEREYYFHEQESVLQPSEYKTYVYAIFNLQRHFQEYFSPFMPEALNQEQIADCLESDICVLNEDPTFWTSTQGHFSLHQHLRRYLIYFFDFDYAKQSFENDFVRHFQNSHRAFRWPEKHTISQKETSTIFDEDYEDLKSMSKQGLTRLFRKKAKELHPDRGGNHEQFIRLCDAYNDLLTHIK